MANVRYDRINEEVKKAISEIVREMKDPRISPMTTIMSAEVTNDLKQAKVRVSVYDSDDAKRPLRRSTGRQDLSGMSLEPILNCAHCRS